MTKASCHTCVCACWDPGQAMQSFSSRFASRPVCEPAGCARPDAADARRACAGTVGPRPPRRGGDVKRILLTGGLYAYVDATDYEWLSRYNWHAYNDGYAARYGKSKRQKDTPSVRTPGRRTRVIRRTTKPTRRR